MSRIVSVWLPRWPIQRFLTAQARSSSREPVDPKQPFVLATDAPGGPRIAALNAAAEADGLMIGDQIADARAKIGILQVYAADPAADAAALRRLALWATRYTPAVSPWGEESGADGLFLDITGAAHLFGGEEMLLSDLAHRLGRFDLPARLAVADTAGAAWALSRFHPSPATVLYSGNEAAALASLPVEALRLSPDTRATLRRLGFKRVGSLIDKPRAPFSARFERELLLRLDQAIGRVPEPLALISPPPAYHSLRQLLEPISTQEAIVAITTHLMEDLVPALVRDGVGARALRLAIYRIDGEMVTVDIGLTLPTRSPAHVARLIDLKLEGVVETIDAGFGFEALSLAVTIAERMEPKQTELASATDGADRTERCAALIDSLRQRLGSRNVRRLAPVASHLPERAETSCPAGEAPVWSTPDETRPRPILLLAHAEPADVMALVPEGPPRRFRWRGMTHSVIEAQGPERIAGEWWRHHQPQPTRDYYLVEDDAGRRFWLYREGLYGRETAAPRWFVHGLFA
ncbi:MAG: DNA polymerase Y family protein [Hyphomicrobiaceae bacterium]|nr:MAG: DNA polymerase Y family protein [Hyphomicrobiaceae bacterium]